VEGQRAYFGVVPTDKCLHAFPLVARLGISHEGRELDFADCFSVARLLMMQGSHDDAERLAVRAVTLEPNSPEATTLLADCKAARNRGLLLFGRDSEALRKVVSDIVQTYQRALAIQPRHRDALRGLAQVHYTVGNFQEAAVAADGLVQAAPNDWKSCQMLAKISFKQQQLDAALQQAQRAKSLVAGLTPEPYILCGNIRYAQNDLEGGRTEFAEASRIHPRNLASRFGLADYYLRRKDPVGEAAECQRILEDMPNHPEVLARLGNCHFDAKRYDEAFNTLVSAKRRCEELEMTPYPDIFLPLGQIQEIRQKINTAYNIYGWLVYHFPASREGGQALIKLVNLSASQKRPGLRAAHLRFLRRTRPDHPDLKNLPAKEFEVGITLDEIKYLVQVDYPFMLAHDLIVDTGRSFDFPREEAKQFEARLLKEEKLPPILVGAILKAPLRASGTKPPEGPGSIVGSWLARITNQQGMLLENVIALKPDGTFTSILTASSVFQGYSDGTYQFDGKTLAGRLSNGQTYQYPCTLQRVQGQDILTITMPGLGPTQFFRQQAPGG
jgi:tetratricopeptide (TPR) repeat protein